MACWVGGDVDGCFGGDEVAADGCAGGGRLSWEAGGNGREVAEGLGKDCEKVGEPSYGLDGDGVVGRESGPDFLLERRVDHWVFQQEIGGAAEKGGGRFAACSYEKQAVGVDLVLRHSQDLTVSAFFRSIVGQNVGVEVRAIGFCLSSFLGSCVNPTRVFHTLSQDAGVNEPEKSADIFEPWVVGYGKYERKAFEHFKDETDIFVRGSRLETAERFTKQQIRDDVECCPVLYV